MSINKFILKKILFNNIQMSGILQLGYNYSTNETKAVSVDSTGKVEVVSSGGGGGGDATAANQVLQLAQETIIAGDTTSLDTKITACDTGAVVVSSSALPTGAATSLAQSSGNASLASIAGAVAGTEMRVDIINGNTQHNEGDALTATATGTLALGKSPTNVADALNLTAGGALRVDDGATTSGSDATLTNAQQVLAYGRDSGGGLDALKVDNQGHLEVVQDLESQTTSIFSGTQNIAVGATHTFTTALDKNGSSQFNLLITTTTATSFVNYMVHIEASDDDITYYQSASTGMIGNTVANIQNAELHLNSLTPRYAKVSIENTDATTVLTITSIKATRINGI